MNSSIIFQDTIITPCNSNISNYNISKPTSVVTSLEKDGSKICRTITKRLKCRSRKLQRTRCCSAVNLEEHDIVVQWIWTEWISKSKGFMYQVGKLSQAWINRHVYRGVKQVEWLVGSTHKIMSSSMSQAGRPIGRVESAQLAHCGFISCEPRACHEQWPKTIIVQNFSDHLQLSLNF